MHYIYTYSSYITCSLNYMQFGLHMCMYIRTRYIYIGTFEYIIVKYIAYTLSHKLEVVSVIF